MGQQGSTPPLGGGLYGQQSTGQGYGQSSTPTSGQTGDSSLGQGVGQSVNQSVGQGGVGQGGVGQPQSANPSFGQPGAGLPLSNPMGNPTGQQLATGMDIPQASANPQIADGDLLDVMVFDTPELSGRFRVSNSGNITLPLVGSLQVSGLTAVEASERIAAKFKEKQVLLQPQVSVFVAEYAVRGVTITGEVRGSGIFPLNGPRNLTDILAQAGGLGESASKTVSIVHRNDPSHIITVKLNVGPQTPASIAAANIAILPGDTIYVARSGVVYVVGDLNRPGGYQVEHNNRLTLLEAVALAGGPTQTSKLSDARLIRRSETGREELKVDLKKILYGGGPDMLLTDGDILFVPISQRKVFTQRGIDTAINAASAFALYKLSTQ
ncbi:MAG: polysaccharide biosynthesis/export family protein [Acidobacteriaceae bacterium]